MRGLLRQALEVSLHSNYWPFCARTRVLFPVAPASVDSDAELFCQSVTNRRYSIHGIRPGSSLVRMARNPSFSSTRSKARFPARAMAARASSGSLPKMCCTKHRQAPSRTPFPHAEGANSFPEQEIIPVLVPSFAEFDPAERQPAHPLFDQPLAPPRPAP